MRIELSLPLKVFSASKATQFDVRYFFSFLPNSIRSLDCGYLVLQRYRHRREYTAAPLGEPASPRDAGHEREALSKQQGNFSRRRPILSLQRQYPNYFGSTVLSSTHQLFVVTVYDTGISAVRTDFPPRSSRVFKDTSYPSHVVSTKTLYAVN